MGISMWSVPGCYKQGTELVQFSSAREAVKTGPERVKLNNLHCESRCQETAGEDKPGWKMLW
jgi:uncharacterized protein YdhG (YjbR/CyaY superfamily)